MYLGISPTKFDEWVKAGKIQPPRLLDERQLFDVYELDLVFDALPRKQVANSWDDR
jgi:hypothetical protein